MTRPERDRSDPAASIGDDRFWQAFAQAGGFDEELRELIASGEIAPADVATAEVTPEDLLAADRFHELLVAAHASRQLTPLSQAPRCESQAFGASSERLIYLGIPALATAASIAVAIWLSSYAAPTAEPKAEVAAVDLAESWVAVQESSLEAGVFLIDDVDTNERVAALAFEETPEWLALAVAGEAELSEEAIEEGTP